MHPCGRRSATTGLPPGVTASSPGTVPISNGVLRPSWVRKLLTSTPKNFSIFPGSTGPNLPASSTGPPSAVASCAAAPDLSNLLLRAPQARSMCLGLAFGCPRFDFLPGSWVCPFLFCHPAHATQVGPKCRALCGTQWWDRGTLSSDLGALGFELSNFQLSNLFSVTSAAPLFPLS